MTKSGQLTPTSARAITLNAPTGPIAALRSGSDTAPDVLLLPGYTGSKEDFTPLLDPLARAGFRVSAIDLPGQYQSAGPADRQAYTPDALGASVRSIAQAMGPVHLVGHSFGGLVARAAAIAAPHLFSDVVLLSSGPGAIGGQRRQRIEDLAPLLGEGLDAVYDAMRAAIAAEAGYVAPPAPLAEFLRNRFLASPPAMLAGMGDALRAEPDRVAELRATGLPLLVVTGEHDDAWPPAVQATMAVRLAAGHVIVPGAAHSPAVENTAATAAALIAFWTR
ncbi:MAG: alpha/beta hydrolase [Actinomycetota bacterium]|nr:alpha/beta hydrolase [Actinomycetota bacterium]